MNFSLLNPGRGLVVQAPPCPIAPPPPTANISRHARRSCLSEGGVKTWLMRISLAYSILLASSIQLLAHSINGQTIDKETVTIELENDNLVALVKKIEDQSTLRFIYLPEQLNKYGLVSLSKAKRTIKETLDLALGGTTLRYEQNGRYVVLSEKKENAAASTAPAVVSPVLSASLVKGKVTDKDGLAMAGVNIVIKGTTTGTTTDGEGGYAILAEANDVLIFSFIGYKTMEVEVGARTIVNMALELDVAALKVVEVVDAGYWKVTEKERTGNIVSIKAADIEGQPVYSPMQAMQGRLSGVYISQNTGLPGSGFDILVRGQNSLRSNFVNNGNLPLYVIDGVPYSSQTLESKRVSSMTNYGNPLNNINPSDIESISILKDADATAIYGSRGANGVVLINTKKGRSGRTKLDANYYQGWGRVSRKMNLLNTDQYLEMRNEAFNNVQMTPADFEYDVNGRWGGQRDTDWQNELIGGTSRINNAQVSLSGGSSQTQFIVSGGYYRESTVFPGDNDFQRGSFHFNLSNRSLNDRLKFSVVSSYVVDLSGLPGADFTGPALTMAPNSPLLVDENGDLNWENTQTPNPLAALLISNKSTTSNNVNNIQFDYQLLKGLVLKANGGYNIIRFENTKAVPVKAFSPSSGITQGYSEFQEATTDNWIVEPQLEFSKVGNNGRLTALLGGTWQQKVSRQKLAVAEGFQDDSALENPAAAGRYTVSEYTYSKYRYTAFFARANYVYRDRYILNATARRDGSSRFGPDRRFGNFGAIGAAWIFSDEVFARLFQSFLSMGKIRGSYGITGNDQIGDYGYLDSYTYMSNSYMGVKGLTASRMPNPDYSWETNKKLEGALELGFFQNRVALSVSYYRNQSSNQLLGYTLPSLTGFSSVQNNLPATVRNSGWEFEVNYNVISNDKLTWNTSFNMTIPRNTIVDFPGLKFSSYVNTYDVGKSTFVKKVYHSLGVNPETGLYNFKDFDDDGSVSYQNDTRFLKEVGQDYYGGLQNSFIYRGFELSFLVQFVRQTAWSYIRYFSMPGLYGNQPTNILARWSNSGESSNVQRYSPTYDATYFAFYDFSSSDAAIVDASFIRLKNISLSYKISSDFLRRIKLDSFRAYAQAQNLLTITKYVGLDPESRGFSLPPLQVFTVGMQIGL